MKLEYLEAEERIKITPASNTELRGVKNWLTRKREGFMFDPRFKMKLWNGDDTEWKTSDNTIPLGLWKEVYKCCVEFGYSYDFINKSEFPINRKIKKEEVVQFYENFFKDHLNDEGKKFTPRDYQIRCAQSILKDRYCNIEVATAGGKTMIFAMVMFYLMHRFGTKKKFLLVVPSKTLVTQFYDDLIALNNGMFGKNDNKIDIVVKEIFGEDEKPRHSDPEREPNITIGTFQSLADREKYPKNWFKQFWSITCDEGHKSTSKSYQKICKSTFYNAAYRWGMSGSFPEEDSCEMMKIMAVTGPISDNIKAKELMDKGAITKVKIKGVLMYHNDFEFNSQLQLVAKRDKKASYDLEVEKARASEEKLRIIASIVKQCQSNTLVLFHNTEYGHQILEYLQKHEPEKEYYFIDGSVSNKKRSAIKKEMLKTDKVRVLVASFGTLSTGVSINTITNIIFCQSFKKAQVIIQSIGRALRLHPGKVMAYIFDLVDVFNHDDFGTRFKVRFKNTLYTHWEKRLQIYAKEQYPVTSVEIQLNSGSDF